LDQALPYDSLAQLRQHMVEVVPSLGEVDEVSPGEMGAFGVAGEVDGAPFESPVADYYLANIIARASAVMAECSRTFLHGANSTDGSAGGVTGTDG
jgi:NADH-quinone oxidoreductase subunit G